ncbi:MAG TPA: oxidoreductase [Lentisphaeria bacterium]|nr:oxidoreductase [Lentisphaeria bacterium]
MGKGKKATFPCIKVHTLIIGSGAAGLNAAVQLDANGVKDILILTEGLQKGTSINTGSDKQTYYKLGMYGENNDSPGLLAQSFFNGGSMHGDLALVEASLSPRAFFNLVNLGVPFPRDRFGQFVGYKTDHDPFRRATSVGPYTSREMCRALIAEVKKRGIPVHEDRVSISLLTVNEKGIKRAAGAIAVNSKVKGKDVKKAIEIYIAENVVFAVGGPGGLYKTSVYPEVHTGAIGLALMEGAKAQSLPESQYGLASIKFRWNVSGTYMQVIPKFISTAQDGKSDVREFMRDYFTSTGEMNSMIFLKGYQWPFDPRKVDGGSSIVDILVYIETVLKGRRVYLDFRANGDGFDFKGLSPEAHEYLEKSHALFGTPIERLTKMNEPAISLYQDHGINIRKEPLEIAVCAQHNNGGLAGNLWWESINIKHLFPVGEVNGSHGVYRPGGSALNSGQASSIRAAEFIANAYKGKSLNAKSAKKAAAAKLGSIVDWLGKSAASGMKWQDVRNEFQSRMSKAAAHIRSEKVLSEASSEAWKQVRDIREKGCRSAGMKDSIENLRNLQLCFAHAVYVAAVLETIKSGVGSRGSALVLDDKGVSAHPKLGKEWKFLLENPEFRNKVLETAASIDGKVENKWVPRRELPKDDAWFETAWAAYRNGEIYK